jgi:hypothetical protein
MALARATDDPALKQYYEELALGFVQKAGNEPDSDNTAVFSILSSPIAATPIGTDANKLSEVYPFRFASSEKSPNLSVNS